MGEGTDRRVYKKYVRASGCTYCVLCNGWPCTEYNILGLPFFREMWLYTHTHFKHGSVLQACTYGCNVPVGHAYPHLQPGNDCGLFPESEWSALLQYLVELLAPGRRER